MKLFNTLTNKKEEFKPLKEGEVSIYVCGPTVYNYVHIGNTRPMIVFDVLRRTFEYLGNKVTFVSNFTERPYQDHIIIIYNFLKRCKRTCINYIICRSTFLHIIYQQTGGHAR